MIISYWIDCDFLWCEGNCLQINLWISHPYFLLTLLLYHGLNQSTLLFTRFVVLYLIKLFINGLINRLLIRWFWFLNTFLLKGKFHLFAYCYTHIWLKHNISQTWLSIKRIRKLVKQILCFLLGFFVAVQHFTHWFLKHKYWLSLQMLSQWKLKFRFTIKSISNTFTKQTTLKKTQRKKT